MCFLFSSRSEREPRCIEEQTGVEMTNPLPDMSFYFSLGQSDTGAEKHSRGADDKTAHKKPD